MGESYTTIPVRRGTRDMVRGLKSGDESYDDLLIRMAEQFDALDSIRADQLDFDTNYDFAFRCTACGSVVAVEKAGGHARLEGHEACRLIRVGISRDN